MTSYERVNGWHSRFLTASSPHDRKQRLAVMAALRVVAARFPGPKVTRLIAAYEDRADHRSYERWTADLGGLNPWGDDLDHADPQYGRAIRVGFRGFGNGGDCRITQIPFDADDVDGVTAVLDDVFGNPFRPVAFADDWRTSTAVGIARAMYESRDFSPMPVLADALEEAGCDAADVLAHCRGVGPHVRGCWVVDQVLGLA